MEYIEFGVGEKGDVLGGGVRVSKVVGGRGDYRYII